MQYSTDAVAPAVGKHAVTAEELAFSQAMDKVRAEIFHHQQTDSRRGFIAKVVSSFYDKDEKSFEHLTRLADKNFSQQITPTKEILKAVEDDRKAVHTKYEIAEFGSNLIKAVPLFMPGKAGLLGSALVYGIDQISPRSGLLDNVVGVAVGAGRGYLSKSVVDYAGRFDLLPLPLKGAATGFALRTVDRGSALMGEMMERPGQPIFFGTLFGLMDPVAIARDAEVALGTGLVYLGVNSLFGGALGASVFRSTVASAGIVGVTGGLLSEYGRQRAANEPISWKSIATHGALTGTAFALGATAGGTMAQRNYDQWVARYPKVAEAFARGGSTLPDKAEDIDLYMRGQFPKRGTEYELVGKLVETKEVPPNTEIKLPNGKILRSDSKHSLMISKDGKPTEFVSGLKSDLFEVAPGVSRSSPMTWNGVPRYRAVQLKAGEIPQGNYMTNGGEPIIPKPGDWIVQNNTDEAARGAWVTPKSLFEKAYLPLQHSKNPFASAEPPKSVVESYLTHQGFKLDNGTWVKGAGN